MASSTFWSQSGLDAAKADDAVRGISDMVDQFKQKFLTPPAPAPLPMPTPDPTPTPAPQPFKLPDLSAYTPWAPKDTQPDQTTASAAPAAPSSLGFKLPDLSAFTPWEPPKTSSVEATPPASAVSSAPAGRPTPAGAQPSAMPSGGGGAFRDNNERLAYVRQSAIAHGHDPDVAARVAMSEGAGPAGSVGDQGTSFGAFQAHVGGGQGDDFKSQTGLDPADPNNERALIDWQLGNLNQTGWSPFHGAAAAGIGDRQGIGTGTPSSARQVAAPSSQPAQSAAPSPMPTTTSKATPSSYTQQGLADAGDPDAWSKCGPVAAYQFALRTGRNPNPSEVEKLAQDAGWTPRAGMAGFQSEAKLLTSMGIAARPENGVDWDKVITDVSRGNPVILQLPGHEGHYITAQGYDAATGKIDFGSTVGDLRAAGHKTQFTPTELENLGWGTPNASLYLDNPATPAPSVAAGASQPAQMNRMSLTQPTSGPDSVPTWQDSQTEPANSDRSGTFTPERQIITTPVSDPSAPYGALPSSPPIPGQPDPEASRNETVPGLSTPQDAGPAQDNPYGQQKGMIDRRNVIVPNDLPPDVYNSPATEMLRQPLSATAGPDTFPTDAPSGAFGASAAPAQPTPGSGAFQDDYTDAGSHTLDVPDTSGPVVGPTQPGASIYQSIVNAAKPVLDAAGNVIAYIHDAGRSPDAAAPTDQTPNSIAMEASGQTGMEPQQAQIANAVATEGIATPIARAIQTPINAALGRPAPVDTGQPETPIDRALVQTGQGIGQDVQNITSGNTGKAILGAVGLAGDLAPTTTLARQLSEMFPKADVPVLGEVGVGDVVMGAQLLHDAIRLGYAVPGAVRAGGRVWSKIADAVNAGVPAEKFAEWAQGVGQRVGSALDENASRVATLDAERAGQGSTVAASAFGSTPEIAQAADTAASDTSRFYHGTASDFERANADKFDPNGLYGPGYYTTDSPVVAGSYSEVRTPQTAGGLTPSAVRRNIQMLEDALTSGRANGESPEILASYEQRLAKNRADLEQLTSAGPNVRPLDVPNDLNLFDLDRRFTDADGEFIANQLEHPSGNDTQDMVNSWAADSFSEALPPNPTGHEIYTALTKAFEGDKQATNEFLAQHGFDGVAHEGGHIRPIMDSAGNPINHEVRVIFPDALPRIRQAYSGEYGGAAIGSGPSLPGRAPGTTGGTGTLGAVNRGVGEALKAGASGAVGAAVNQQANPDDPNAAWKGFAVGALAPSLINHGMGALARRAGREIPQAEGALSALGAAPGPRRRLVPPGAREITATPAEEVSRLRLDKFPEEVRGDIEAAAKDTNFAREQRRGVLPDDVVQQMAQDDQKSVDDLIKGSKAGKAYNPEETVALRNTVASQANVVRDLSDQIAAARAEGHAPELLVARRASEATKLSGLVQLAEGARAEAGRTLRQYRQQAQLIEMNPDQAVERIYRKLGGRDNASAAVDQYTQMIKDGADPIQMAKFWGRVEAGDIKGTDLFALYRRFNMLSGPRTIEVNGLSGAVNLSYEVLAQAVGQAARGRFADAASELSAPLAAAPRAFQNMAEIFQHGVSTEQALRGDIPRTLSGRVDNPVAKGALTVLEAPDRFNAGVDDFFRTMTEDWAARMLANKQARAEGLTPRSANWADNVAQKLQTIRDDPSKFAEIKEMADHVTFSETPGALGQALGAVQRVPYIGTMLMPFVRTPYNIASRAIDMSPLGVVRTAAEVATGKGRGTANLSRRVRDNVIGTAGALWAYDQAQQGNITGAGPDDPEKLAELRATGWQPFSVKIGDKYWSYSNFAPFSLALSTGAAAAEAQKYAKPGKTDTLSMLADGAKRTASVVSDMTVLAGLGAVVKSIQDPERYGTQWLTQFLQTLIPAGSALSTIGQATDPTIRRAERTDVGTQIAQNLEARVPGLRNSVPAAQDPLGRDVPNEQTGLGALNPFRPTTERPDPVLQPFIDAGVDVGAPRQQLSVVQSMPPIPLTPAEQRRWNELRGKMLIDNIPKSTGAAAYQAGDRSVHQRSLQLTLNAINSATDKQLIAEIGGDEVKRRLLEANALKRAS